MPIYQVVKDPFHVQDENGDIVGYQKDKGPTMVFTPRYSTDASGNVTGMVGPGGTAAPIAVTLKQTAVPVILAPNGTVATNGTITLGTALPTTYANAWVRLPAGAVSGGSAGLYYATFSSTTVGVITTTFADAATAFSPYIPSSTVVAVGSNSAYTQTTGAEVTLFNVTVPGGMLGANGSLRYTGVGSHPNNANAKSYRAKLSSAIIFNTSPTTTLTAYFERMVHNRGTASSQVIPSTGLLGTGTASAAGPTYSAVDTSVDQAFIFTAQLAVATDYLVLEAFTVEVLPA